MRRQRQGEACPARGEAHSGKPVHDGENGQTGLRLEGCALGGVLLSGRRRNARGPVAREGAEVRIHGGHKTQEENRQLQVNTGERREGTPARRAQGGPPQAPRSRHSGPGLWEAGLLLSLTTGLVSQVHTSAKNSANRALHSIKLLTAASLSEASLRRGGCQSGPGASGAPGERAVDHLVGQGVRAASGVVPLRPPAPDH